MQATRAILERLRTLFRGKMPIPERFLAMRPARLREIGLSRRKVATLRTVAKQFVQERLSLRKLRKLTDDEILALLTSIPGIGPWTVQGFLIIALNRGDVVLPGDLALRKAIKQTYELSHLPSEDEVLEVSQRWRPYRSLAMAYLFQSAFDAAGIAILPRSRRPGEVTDDGASPQTRYSGKNCGSAGVGNRHIPTRYRLDRG